MAVNRPGTADAARIARLTPEPGRKFEPCRVRVDQQQSAASTAVLQCLVVRPSSRSAAIGAVALVWQTTNRRYLAEATMALLTAPAPQEAVVAPELMTA